MAKQTIVLSSYTVQNVTMPTMLQNIVIANIQHI